jgi:2-keto-4-pentenoate hydratase/2-oxohepta-3-ene-1,7-dioic acid hydratase in catechol pathway
MRLATIMTPHGPRGAARDGLHFIELGMSVRQYLEAGMPAVTVGERHVAASAELLAPIPDPPKVICIGLNYRDHAAETGQAIPREPVVFSKFPTAIIGPEQSIVLPSVSHKVDFEAELVLVIGKGGKNIPREKAMAHIVGLTVGHDVSARDWQIEKDGRQWLLGKTFDTFAPIGPHIVTMDEAGDVNNLAIKLRLNGTTMQDSSTAQLIFRPDELVAYVSQVFTLQAGDIIFTGTPPGVGVARKPPVWLKHGDVCEVEIQGLGVLRNPVVAG